MKSLFFYLVCILFFLNNTKINQEEIRETLEEENIKKESIKEIQKKDKNNCNILNNNGNITDPSICYKLKTFSNSSCCSLIKQKYFNIYSQCYFFTNYKNLSFF